MYGIQNIKLIHNYTAIQVLKHVQYQLVIREQLLNHGYGIPVTLCINCKQNG